MCAQEKFNAPSLKATRETKRGPSAQLGLAPTTTGATSSTQGTSTTGGGSGALKRDETLSSSSSTYIRGAAPIALDIRDGGLEGKVSEGEEEDEEDSRLGKHVFDDYEDIYGQYADSDLNSSPPKPIHHIELNRPTPSTAAAKLGSGALGRLKPGGKGAPSISKRTLPLATTATHGLSRWLPQSWPTRLFLLVTLAEAVADISIEAVLLSRYKEQQGSIELSALPVFVMVFALAHVYQCFLAFDTVVNRNLILVVGLNVFNLAFLIYAIIQISEIRDVLGDGVIQGTSQTVPVQVLTGAIPAIIGCTSLVLSILAWFLWKEFGWQIYKTIGADRNLKRAHLQYQIYVCLLKFDFFTFTAFCLQLVLVVLKNDTAERVITILALPVCLLLLVFAWYACRHEIKWGMGVFMAGQLGGAGYFSYKLYRIWSEKEGQYKEVYKSLTVFSVLALALLFATALVSIRCLLNFDMGLKGAMTRSAAQEAQAKHNHHHQAQYSHGTSAMSISAPYGSKGMLPLRSNSTLGLERTNNPRLSLD